MVPMSNIYQLTNRKTHARAVVICASEQQAREMRPDGAIWRDRWVVYHHASMTFIAAPELPAWPVEPKHASAQLLARHVESAFDVHSTVVAFDANTEPRQRGEGPDEWWSDDE